MGASDTDLLRDYAQGSEAAFASLVARHLNLVYSAARRQVRSPQLAEEVAQSVFCDLARQAARFPRGTALNGWLYLVTRRTAIDAVRRESRRLAHEQAAAEISLMQSTPSAWSRVEPVLDEAMAALSASDRSALLLRFFENKPLHEIGAALGTSEDAAQKRVSRAVDQLRALLVRRGIAVSGATLAAELSAHAIQLAPAGLGVTISTAAALSGAAGSVAALEATKVIAMTTIQKALLASTLAFVLGAGLYGGHVFARHSSDVQDLRAELNHAEIETVALRQAQNIASTRLAAVDRQIDARLAAAAALSPMDRSLTAQMKEWFGQLDRMNELLKQRPEWNTSELRLLTEQDWFDAASGGLLDTEEKLRGALSGLRQKGDERLTFKVLPALKAFLKAHDGALPDNARDLAPFLDAGTEPSLLDRYEVLQTGNARDLSTSQQARLLAPRTPGDVEFDNYRWLGINGATTDKALDYDIREAQKKFATNNEGRRAISSAQLEPYLKWPATAAVVQRRLDATTTRKVP